MEGPFSWALGCLGRVLAAESNDVRGGLQSIWILRIRLWRALGSRFRAGDDYRRQTIETSVRIQAERRELVWTNCHIVQNDGQTKQVRGNLQKVQFIDSGGTESPRARSCQGVR